jgi:ornithine decarboxylase
VAAPVTPKIAHFLSDTPPATPCLVLDLDRVEENFNELQAAFRRRGFSMP